MHIWEQALGPDHPWVAEPLHGLANLCRNQGKEREAESLYLRTLEIQEQQLGQHHPETAQTLHDLALFREAQGHLDEAVSLAERALQIHSQALGEGHPQTAATQTLCARLIQEQNATAKGVPSQHGEKESPYSSADLPHSSAPEETPVQDFLTTCCDLHPLAWCPIRELWHAYEHWSATSQQRVPVSRRAFAAQVKARGCRADRTSTTRIWRGIRLVNKKP